MELDSDTWANVSEMLKQQQNERLQLKRKKERLWREAESKDKLRWENRQEEMKGLIDLKERSIVKGNALTS